MVIWVEAPSPIIRQDIYPWNMDLEKNLKFLSFCEIDNLMGILIAIFFNCVLSTGGNTY